MFTIFLFKSLGHLQLFYDPMDRSPQGSYVYGISQATILEWVAISFSGGSSRPRDRTHISCVGRKILYHWATREALSSTWELVKNANSQNPPQTINQKWCDRAQQPSLTTPSGDAAAQYSLTPTALAKSKQFLLYFVLKHLGEEWLERNFIKIFQTLQRETRKKIWQI